MIKYIRTVILLACILLPVAVVSLDLFGKPADKASKTATQKTADNKSKQHFTAEVVSILENKCVACHNSKDAKGELALDNFTSAVTKGGESGEVIEPGDAASSLLMEYISGDKPEMPKGDSPLSKKRSRRDSQVDRQGSEVA